MYFNDLWANFIKDEVIFRGFSQNTLGCYECFKVLFNRYVGNPLFSGITMDVVRQFIESLMAYQKQDTTRGYIGNLKSYLRYAVTQGATLGLDVELIRQPRRSKRRLEIPTEQQVEGFINLVAAPCRGYSNLNRLRNIAIMQVLYSSGIRVSELCSLNRGDIKDRQFVVIGKSKEPRLCFITPQAEQALKTYLAARNDINEALFIQNANGRRITPPTVRNVFQNTCKRSNGLYNGIHPHTLRHCYATRLINRNVDIGSVGTLLGHASLDTTRVYVHYSNPKLKAIYDSANGNLY